MARTPRARAALEKLLNRYRLCRHCSSEWWFLHTEFPGRQSQTTVRCFECDYEIHDYGGCGQAVDFVHYDQVGVRLKYRIRL